MDDIALTWLTLVARWAHVVTGAAWIGTSFYFNWLNDSLEPPETGERGVGGQLWAVHGGAFYHVRKFVVAPERLPARLHWFKWEAYFTWITGVALLVLVYYLDARAYLVDPAVSAITPGAAVALSVASLVLGWLVYDGLCRSPLGRRPGLLAGVGFVLMVAVAWGLSRVLSGRAAYMHVGAMLGTVMAANVFFAIIPGQRAMVDAMLAGQEPDAERGRQGALRSRHNNYLTLPVLFVMVSNHFPLTYGGAGSWAVLAALTLIGVGVRHWFNVRHLRRAPAWGLPAAAAGLLATAFIAAPHRLPEGAAAPASFAAARAVIERRCVPCHSAAPTGPWYPAAPNGVAMDTPEQIRALAARIEARVVTTRDMPLGNLTQMTDQEREILAGWLAAGAPAR